MATLRHEFYETDERLTLSVFDKGANPEEVSIKFEPRSLTYQNGEKKLILEPLKGQIDPEKSDYTVGKVKVEIRLGKMAQGRWGALVGDSPDPLSQFPSSSTAAPTSSARQPPRKNWDGITNTILGGEKPVTTEQDPNAGGDAAVNEFFQKLFADADEDTKRAMMKSYQESGGTTLSTTGMRLGRAKLR
ncbi:Protein SGT1 B [Grifola frondosa]|uniref:Protein SGT1 B n=1 Tax=Grifola frondosa TaxID=5627 RepID=A0A1C7MSR0_GRIFR|nr:Protein SGT1 B [Grifola frondosa]